MRGEIEVATARYREALAATREAGDRLGVATFQTILADFAHWGGDAATAQALAEEALALWRELGDKGGIAAAVHVLASIACRRADTARASVLHAESLATWVELGDRRALAGGLAMSATLAVKAGRPESAARFLGASAASCAALGVFPFELYGAHERATTETRAALSTDVFTAAWAAGRALSLEQAVAEATSLAAALARPDAPGPPAESAAVLTRRELEVLALLAEGRSDRDFATALFISHGTARTHVANILGKLNVGTRAAAVALAFRQGLLKQ